MQAAYVFAKIYRGTLKNELVYYKFKAFSIYIGHQERLNFQQLADELIIIRFQLTTLLYTSQNIIILSQQIKIITFKCINNMHKLVAIM